MVRPFRYKDTVCSKRNISDNINVWNPFTMPGLVRLNYMLRQINNCSVNEHTNCNSESITTK